MTLPKGFLFTQSNLQDYVDCQRRFQLRYILHLDWPAVEAEPIQEHELMIIQGSQFHKIIRQHLTGIPESEIERSIMTDDKLHLYWRNYIQSRKDGVLAELIKEDCRYFEEITFTTPLPPFRLIAKYDLLVVHPDGKLVILDWKTSQNRPKRKWLGDRMQTRVYPYVLTWQTAGITDQVPVDPNRIDMVYWFSNYPNQPESFHYSELSYRADTKYLSDLVAVINQKTESVFPLTPDVKHCLFCTYRSLCDRGITPGQLSQLEELQETEPTSTDVSIDFEQVIEIEY